jgi:hypothetical protein
MLFYESKKISKEHKYKSATPMKLNSDSKARLKKIKVKSQNSKVKKMIIMKRKLLQHSKFLIFNF